MYDAAFVASGGPLFRDSIFRGSICIQTADGSSLGEQ